MTEQPHAGSMLHYTCITPDCGKPCSGLKCEDCRAGRVPAPRGAVVPGPPALPLRITVPWSALASDNLRKGIAGAANRDKQKQYDVALHKFREAVAAQCTGIPCPGPLQVIAVFYMPNNQRRDHHNFTKLIMDGIKSLIAIDDAWQEVRRTIFDVAAIDVDRPRCELIIKQWEEVLWYSIPS